MSLMVKLEHPERTLGEHANFTQKGPGTTRIQAQDLKY